MRNVKLTISYCGTDYHGWQRQKKGITTVQQVLEEAVKQGLGHSVKIRGSGRTDTGVHAAGQVANFFTDSPIPTEKMYRIITRHLPADIRVIRSEDVSDDFDPIISSRSKLYRYTVFNNYEIPIQARPFCYQYYHTADAPTMQTAAAMLVGEHDFASFTPTGQKRQSTVRTLYRCQVWRKYHYVYFDLEGSGFLYHMVRNIVGTLLDIGRGHRLPDCIPEILSAKNRDAAGPMAPANGLCLQWVRY